MALLTPAQVAQQQAISEGFQSGPLPTVNPVNIDTQAKLSNTVPSIAEPVPYYPPATNLTPNLGLSLQGLDPVVAEDMVTIDTALAGGGSSGIVKTATVTLTNAQILAMSGGVVSAPILPAPGPGLMYFLLGIQFMFVCALGYTGLSGGDFGISIQASGGTLTDLVDYSPTTGFFDQTGKTMVLPLYGNFSYLGGATPYSMSSNQWVNRPVIMFIEDTFSGGNAANTLQITMFYTTVPVSSPF